MSEIDVVVQEVGPRDGLQNVERTIPTDAKMEWIDAVCEAGVPQVQVGSFVPPRLLPQLADTAEIVRRTREGWPEVALSVLIPNLKGAELALADRARPGGFRALCLGRPQRAQRAPPGRRVSSPTSPASWRCATSAIPGTA